MRVAIIGTGISGMVAAYRLCRQHEITVFEAADRIGGHTCTVDVDREGMRYAVDMGFIVFNDWTYPRLCALLAELGVESQPSNMSFSFSCARSGLEYNGTSLDTLFAQRRNLVNARFLRMLADILRFNRSARALERAGCPDVTLGEYLAGARYSRAFIERYLVPMGRSIWSASQSAILDCPLGFFVDFFARHGFLSIDERPAWRAVRGGSREYARRLAAPWRNRVRLRTPVAGVRRSADGVALRTARGEVEQFDYVVFACHSDQALRLLDPATPLEREILGAFPYQANDAVLHTDTRMLPRTPRARAAWNYHRLALDSGPVAITYDMNILQSLRAPAAFMVTLNRSQEIDPRCVLHRERFHHPVYTPAAVAAQRRRSEVSGHNRSFFAGAYWRYGFHEDGCISGEWAAEELGRVAAAQASQSATVLERCG
jgi:predicted NAD/FAD-binding protein